jgi:nucleotide-binding universal stress UspA family protein
MFGPLELGGILESDLRQQREKVAEKALNDFLAAEFQGVPVRRIVRYGDAAVNIVEQAHDEPGSLIVMPTRGRGPLRQSLLGSVTAKVLNDADCPVFTGAHLVTPAPFVAPKFRNIICAIDLGPHSQKVLQWCATFAVYAGAKLTVLHVMPLAPDGVNGYLNPELNDRLRRQATARLEETMRGAGVETVTLVEEGEDPADTVSAMVARHTADLLVIGRSSSSGAFGRLRQHAYAIIRQVPCPVISV